MSLSQEDLAIMIEFKTKLDGLKQAKQGLREFGQEGDKTDIGLRKSINNMLRPLTELRQTIYRLRFVWLATFGAVIGFMITTANKAKEIKKLASEFGISVEEAGKKFYGMKVSDDDIEQAKKFTAEWERLKVVIESIVFILGTELLKGFNELIEDVRNIIDYSQALKTENKKAELDAVYKKRGFWSTAFGKGALEQKQILKESSDKMRKVALAEMLKKSEARQVGLDTKVSAVLSADETIAMERKSREIHQEMLKMSGQEIQLFKETRDAEYRILRDSNEQVAEEYKRMTDYKLQLIKMEQLGIRQNWQIMRDITKDSIGTMRNIFTDFFTDVFQGKLKTAREYFYAFVQDIGAAWSKAMADMMISSIIGRITGTIGAVGMGGGGGMGGSTGTSGPSVLTARASGGWVGLKGAELALVGEKEPEYVTPLSKMGGGNGGMGGGVTNVNYYIQAVDAASFVQLVNRNPDAILAVTNKSIKQNSSLRRAIKNYT